MVCGNGGSGADAAHILGELVKGFMRKRPKREDESIFVKRASYMPVYTEAVP